VCFNLVRDLYFSVIFETVDASETTTSASENAIDSMQLENAYAYWEVDYRN
jgi:hypothetical protein